VNSYYKIFIYSNIRDFASNYLLYNDLKNKNNLIRDECASGASGKGGDPKNNGMLK